jgi:signal transduction histidine kinase
MDRADFWSALADEEGRMIAVELPRDPIVIGLDRDSLGALLDALLGNVFAHTPEGTPARISLHRRAEPGGAVLAVADRGPGLAVAQAAERGVSGAGSTGLGLDIVRRTAAAAGGSMRLEATPGGGLTVVVELGPPTPGQIRGHRRPRRTLAQWLRRS